jgi:hypothetical protein
VHTMLGSFLHPSAHFHFLLYPPLTPRYSAETILPLSLILLKREYKQKWERPRVFASWDKGSYTGSWLTLISRTCVLSSKLILLELIFSLVPGPLRPLASVALKYLL